MRTFIFSSLLLLLAACATRPVMPAATVSVNSSTTPVPTVAPTAFLQFDNETHLLDLTTGKDVSDFNRIRGGMPVFSKDSKKLATMETSGQVCQPSDGGTACYAAASVLHIVDLQTQKEVTATAPSAVWAGNFRFNSDATRLAIIFNKKGTSIIRLVEALTGQTLRDREIDFLPSAISFAQDGKTLEIYGQAAGDLLSPKEPPPPRVVVLNSATLDTEWDKSLENVLSGSWCPQDCAKSFEEVLSESWNPAALFSRDGGKLYIVHADSDNLTTIDFSTRTVSTAEIHSPRSWIEILLDMTANVADAKGPANGAYRSAVLSVDGSRLYIISQVMKATTDTQNQSDTAYTLSDLEIIDTTTGQKIASHAMSNQPGVREYLYDVNLTPDGKQIFVVRGDEKSDWRTEVFDANTLNPTTRLDGWRLMSARQRDGQPILVAHNPSSTLPQLGTVDEATFQIAKTWSLKADDFWVEP